MSTTPNIGSSEPKKLASWRSGCPTKRSSRRCCASRRSATSLLSRRLCAPSTGFPSVASPTADAPTQNIAAASRRIPRPGRTDERRTVQEDHAQDRGRLRAACYQSGDAPLQYDFGAACDRVLSALAGYGFCLASCRLLGQARFWLEPKPHAVS